MQLASNFRVRIPWHIDIPFISIIWDGTTAFRRRYASLPAALVQAARSAVRSMIDLLTRRHGMPAVDAYLLCSVCGDLRISEIVDIPHWTVSFYFPRVVLD